MTKPASCHPDKTHLARGLCANCYAKEPDQRARYKTYTKTEKWKAQQAKWSKSPLGRASAKSRRLLNGYGLTMDQYQKMLQLQGGGCAICGTAPPKTGKLAVDHCHSTGKIRGLLCIPCNLILGNAKDRTETLASAIQYLSRYFGPRPS